MLSHDELALLEAIRESGSLSRAAARLGKAPSTVSHAARQLEGRFDALLFDRRRYRLQLTPAGALLAQEAARLMHDVSRLTQRVKQVAGGWEDRLWIVTDEVLEFETLLPVIQSFDKLGSGVSLRVTHEVLGGTWCVTSLVPTMMTATCGCQAASRSICAMSSEVCAPTTARHRTSTGESMTWASPRPSMPDGVASGAGMP
jgi:molybdenum-dependent DNA-binding transcriptional regulator ModE